MVEYVDSTKVADGISCDVYRFKNDDSKDLAIVTVDKGRKTPLRKVVLGDETIEGYFAGEGSLTVTLESGEQKEYNFGKGDEGSVSVKVGQKMQWQASSHSELVIFEICTPPYEEGRFKQIDE